MSPLRTALIALCLASVCSICEGVDWARGLKSGDLPIPACFDDSDCRAHKVNIRHMQTGSWV